MMTDPRQMKTKRERKEQAQAELLHALSTAFYRVADEAGYDGMDDEAREMCYADLDEQMKRIEKLFGYEPGSWSRW